MPHLPQSCQGPSVVASCFEDAKYVPGVYPVIPASTFKMSRLFTGQLGVCPH